MSYASSKIVKAWLTCGGLMDTECCKWTHAATGNKNPVLSLNLKMPRYSHPNHTKCKLCARIRPLEFHHLIPKKVHRRTFYRKNYSRDQLNIGVWICRLCHKGIHKFYSEIELAKSLNNLESLKNDLKVQRHIEWSRKQKISEPSK